MAGLIIVVESDSYLSRAEKLMSESERGHVVDLIAIAPESGVVVKGTGGLRKLRIPLAGRGKRGGGRVVYWFHSVGFPAVLLWVYAKNEADDLSSEQRKRMVAIADRLLESFGGDR
jgi:hypothetical protein